MAKEKKENVNPVEEYLISLISEQMKKREIEIKKSDAKQIVSNIIPEIDIMIAKRVKQHFIEIADFIKDKFSEEK